MEKHSRGEAHGDSRPALTPYHDEISDRRFSVFFHEAVVQHVLTLLILVNFVEELYTLHGE